MQARHSLILPSNAWEFVDLIRCSLEPVLLHGETGTGKTFMARCIHNASVRARGDFVAVNCAALSESLVESEMFGHARGAFTGALESRAGLFEVAHRGTLFLDELGELPLTIQPKLLHTLEAGVVRRVGATKETPVDVRVITATHRDLWAATLAGRFRQDLYFRCAVVEFTLPPLRRRMADFEPLCRYLLSIAVPGRPPAIAPDTLAVLRAYSWPGNIRELSNALRRAAVLAKGGVIRVADLPERIRLEQDDEDLVDRRPGEAKRYVAPANTSDERSLIERAMRDAGGNKTHAAERLGMARSTLWAKLRAHGFDTGAAENRTAIERSSDV